MLALLAIVGVIFDRTHDENHSVLCEVDEVLFLVS